DFPVTVLAETRRVGAQAVLAVLGAFTLWRPALSGIPALFGILALFGIEEACVGGVIVIKIIEQNATGQEREKRADPHRSRDSPLHQFPSVQDAGQSHFVA